MPETFLSIARGIFGQKYRELSRLCDALDTPDPKALANAARKIREYEALVAELQKNLRRAQQLLVEVKRRYARAKRRRK